MKMNKNMSFIKEFSITTDPDVESLYFGALPSEGRYFTKKCKKVSEGQFTIKVEVPKGDLYYHFKNPDDPDNILLDPNNFQIGAKNWHSICRIGTTSFNQIEFVLSNSYFSMINEKQVEVKVISHQKWINTVELIIQVDDANSKEHKLQCVGDINNTKYHRLIINKTEIENRNFYFKIYTDDDIFNYDTTLQLSKTLTKPFKATNEFFVYYPPKYIGPIYQIFPDSFAKENTIEVKGRKILPVDSKPEKNSFFGGNIEGIINKLDYIESLGIKCIYLTPIFWANSNDRYDCIDYKKIDPMLGDTQKFNELCENAHSRNIKIVLDVVLNHCGTDFYLFADVLKNQNKSAYKEYFYIISYPIKISISNPNYSSWWGYGNMPQFNLKNNKVTNYLFECCQYWLNEFNIDGWRIDVSSELEHNFLKQFRIKMTEKKEETVLIGENWKDAREFLHGDELDGVTNYLSWWKAFVPFFCEKVISISEFANSLMQSYFVYSLNRSLSNWNVLSSHDVPRFFSKISDKVDSRNVIACLMFIPGNPVIYYGDEIQLQGEDTPDNRHFMTWDKVNESNDLLLLYKQLAKIRNNKNCLQYGDMKVSYLNDNNGLLILEREYEKTKIWAIFNFSNKKIEYDFNSIVSDNELIDVLHDRIISHNLIIDKKDFILLEEKRGKK